MSLDFIAEMAWKSAAISGVALLALGLLRSRSATDRAAVVRLAVVMLLLLPVVSLGLPALQVEGPAPVVEAVAARPLPLTLVDSPPLPAGEPLVEPPAPAAPLFELPVGLLLMLGYLTGVVLLMIRLFVGLWTLRRWTADAEPVTSTEWAAALRRAAANAGLVAPVRLLASDDVRSPLGWGLRHPVILIDYDTAGRAEDADGVLAHEIAHVARRDWAMLMLSRLAVALFWFNPLVWLLERALVEHAEEAADLAAVAGVEPVSYARTLVACGVQAGGQFLPANSIAASHGLARRVRAVLDESRRDTPSGSAWTGAAMLLCIAVSAPIAALELVAPKPPSVPTPPVTPRVPVAARAADAALPPAAPVAPAVPPAAVAPAAPLAPFEAEPVGLADLETAVERATEVEAMSQARIAAFESSAKAMARSVETAAVATQAAARTEALAATAAATAARSAGVAAEASRPATRRAALDVDELIEMRMHGIDAAYLAEVASISPKLRLSADQLVQAKIHGLSPARLREFAALVRGGTGLDDLVAMQIHGVTPTFVRDMAGAGYRGQRGRSRRDAHPRRLRRTGAPRDREAGAATVRRRANRDGHSRIELTRGSAAGGVAMPASDDGLPKPRVPAGPPAPERRHAASEGDDDVEEIAGGVLDRAGACGSGRRRDPRALWLYPRPDPFRRGHRAARAELSHGARWAGSAVAAGRAWRAAGPDRGATCVG